MSKKKKDSCFHIMLGDGDLFLRSDCIDAIVERNFHNGKYDVEIFLTSGQKVSCTLDFEYADRVLGSWLFKEFGK